MTKRSGPLTIKQGVPQGSVLRPIYFLLFVNDTPLQPSRSIDIFADDTTEGQLVRTKERRKRKSEQERRGDCTLSFYNGYFGDFWPKKQLLAVTFS